MSQCRPLVILACAIWGVLAQGQSLPEPTLPGETAPGVAPGSPASAYALAGFDTVNLFNGHLNARIPVVTIGGRGEAQYTMYLPLEPNFFAAFDPMNGAYVGNTTLYPENIDNPFTPGELDARSEYGSSVCQGYSVTGYATVTRLVFTEADGTEHELIDTKTYSRPFYAVDCPNGPTPDRGTEFIATDGSGMVFVSSADIIDLSNAGMNGWLYFRNGLAYQILGGQVITIRDRNGNEITLTYENQSTLGMAGDAAIHRLLSVTDPLGRQATIQYPSGTPYPESCLTLTYRASSPYKVCELPLGNLSEIQQDYTTVTPSPEAVPAWAVSMLRSDYSQTQNMPYLFQASGLAISNSITEPWNPILAASLILPNNQQYSFLYNYFGEISQINLPTGGAILYDFDFAPGVVPNGYSTPEPVLGIYPNYTLYRRLLRRRIYVNSGDQNPQQDIAYSNQTVGGNSTATVTYKDGSGTVWKTEYHQFQGAPELETTYNYQALGGFPNWSDGMETLIQENTPSGSTLKQVSNYWFEQALPAGIANNMYPTVNGNAPLATPSQGGIAPQYNPRISQTITTIDGATSGQVYCYDDSQAFNNRTDVYEYNFGATGYPAVGACPAPSSGYTRHTRTEYKTDAAYTTDAVHLISLPIKKQVLDPNDNSIAETDYTYDFGSALSDAPGVAQHDSGFGTGYSTRGNVIGVSRWVSGANWVSTSSTFDIAGNVRTATDANHNQTSYDYTDNWNGADPAPSGTYTYAFPTTVTNPLNQVSRLAYDYNVGKLASLLDLNTAETTYSYNDPLFRLTSVNYPIGSTATYNYHDNVGSISVTTTQSMTISGGNSCDASQAQTVTNYDGLGRQTSSEAIGPNGPIYTNQTYDALGRVYKVSNPFESGTPVWTATTYDVLNRVLSVTAPDSSVTQSMYSSSSDSNGTYDQTQVIDPAGNQRTTYNDSLGRLVKVFAPGPSSVSGENYTTADYTTSYAYDVLDDLTQVTTSQASRNRTFDYDGLGRLTSATNPENGTVQYSLYDDNGNLKTRVDFNNVTTSYTYDALNRLTQKSYSDNLTPTVIYTYGNSTLPDTVNFTDGRLLSVSTSAVGAIPAIIESYSSYDALGRVLASSESVGSQSYPFTYVYNDLSLDTETYPSGRKVQTCYDSAGRVKQLTNITEPGLTPYAALAYALANGTSQTTNTLGNGLVETVQTNTRLQASSIQVGNLLTLTYGYGTGGTNNGNVMSQSITRTGPGAPAQSWSQSYAYDSLNRISCANENPTANPISCGTGNPNWLRTFGGDPFGNEWTASNTDATLAESPFTPTMPSNFDSTNHLQIDGTNYDGNGNQTAIGGYTFGHDAENRMTWSKINGTTTNYGYDGDGRRVTKSTGASTTTYAYDAMGNLIAEYGGAQNPDSGTTYVSVDSLGSTRLITDANRNPIHCFDYLAFGEDLYSNTDGRGSCFPSVPVEGIRFTSKQRDAETGLDYFGARYFSGMQGRFTSPDPLLNSAHPADPQTWNRYSYALNNPLKIVDPNGLYNLWNTCAADDKKCNKQFEQDAKNLKTGLSDLQKRVDQMKDSPEKQRLQTALFAIGTENDYNNVNVMFGGTNDGAAAQTDPVYNQQTNYLDFNVTFDPKQITGGTNDWAIDAAHEGTHIADISDPRYANPATTLSPFSLEYRGYQTSSWAASALGLRSLSYGNGRYQIWNRSWGAVDDKVLTTYLKSMTDQQGHQNHPETVPHNPWGNP